jgi:hypothetical protein
MKRSRRQEDNPDQPALPLLVVLPSGTEEPGAHSWHAGHHVRTPEPPEGPMDGPGRPAA